ncbi:hypothetical protein [Streptomyces sp. NPDC002644]
MEQELWERMGEAARAEIDAAVRQGTVVRAVQVVRQALPGERVGIHQALDLVGWRTRALGDLVGRPDPDPLDLSSLLDRAAALPGRVVAVEALWDGDTVHDWFVDLVALADDPEGEAPLATVRWRTGGPPPAQAAAQAGRALAERLGVPFHFPSPDVPDDQAPRWRAR